MLIPSEPYGFILFLMSLTSKPETHTFEREDEETLALDVPPFP
jgi:hypothetical protein